MLKIFEQLQPFFEDNFRRVHVREYAKLTKTTPPTASKTLQKLHNEGLLKKTIDKKHHLYYAKRESLFKDLQRIYYKEQLQNTVRQIRDATHNPTILLFGSLAQAEANKHSDIDLAVFTPTNKQIKIETALGRELQIFQHKTLEDVPEDLRKNILNGYIISGHW